MSDEMVENRQLVLICGESGTGKSASLLNIRNQERWLYLNCESGKRLPFKNKFAEEIITDPYQVTANLQLAVENPDAINGVIIDTATFLMEMYESNYVLPATNTQSAWNQYQQYWKELMQQKVARMTKPTVILGHTRTEITDTGEQRVQVPVKGALRNNGLEAYFTLVVGVKKMKLIDLKPYENDMLNITEDDEIVGYKHVFQTRITKSTTGERIRSPLGMFSIKQTYIDNDAQMLLDFLADYYGD